MMRGMGRVGPVGIGRGAEEEVAAVLRAAGWTVLGRNVRCGRNELDIVGVDPGPPPHLAIVEVRWRASRSHGLPEETVGRRKTRALREGLGWLLARGSLPDGTPLPRLAVRLDLVAVEPGAGGGIVLRHHRGVMG
jgi:Holliday junction resolvase-like predicted endonuclease